MKRYIHADTSLQLSDIISKIDYFVVVDDCAEYDLSVINASDGIDGDDTEYLLSLPDRRLAALPDDKIESIVDIGVLDRLAKICKDRLTDLQIAILKAEYEKKLPLDDVTKEELLTLFKECNKVIVSPRKKNLDFLAMYDLTDKDVLAILHALRKEDFDSKTRSINYGHLGNTLMLLHPRILIPYEGVMVGANLYVKLDIDETTKSAAVFISIHPRIENKRSRNEM